MSSIKCSRDTSFSFFFIVFVVSGFAFGTRYWFEDEHEILDIKSHGGLWQICLDIDDDAYCERIGFATGDGDSLYMGTQICMCVAVGCYLIPFICYCVWVSMSQQFLEENGAGSAGNAALSFELIGGLSNLAAVAQFGALFTSDAGKLSYSYYLAVASCAIMTLNSIISMCAISCCRTPQNVRPVVISTTVTPHYGEVTVITSEASYPHGQPMVLQTAGYPNTGPHMNQGYVPDWNQAAQNVYTPYPSAPPSNVDNIPPPDYSMLHKYPTMPNSDNLEQVHHQEPTPNPDHLDKRYGYPSTYM